jgi:hypothetical protein
MKHVIIHDDPYWEVYLACEVGEQGHPFLPHTLTFQARYPLFPDPLLASQSHVVSQDIF